MSALENALQTLGLNILEFFSWIIIGGLFLVAGLAVILCCVAWREDDT